MWQTATSAGLGQIGNGSYWSAGAMPAISTLLSICTSLPLTLYFLLYTGGPCFYGSCDGKCWLVSPYCSRWLCVPLAWEPSVYMYTQQGAIRPSGHGNGSFSTLGRLERISAQPYNNLEGSPGLK